MIELTIDGTQNNWQRCYTNGKNQELEITAIAAYPFEHLQFLSWALYEKVEKVI